MVFVFGGIAVGCLVAAYAFRIVEMNAVTNETDATPANGYRPGADPGDEPSAGTVAPRRATPGTADRATRVPAGDLPPFDVLTLQYTPYMATLALIAARGYLEDEGYELRLHDVYDAEVDLDEEGQCGALAGGEYDALATTLDATRKCGAGVAVGIPIGQSAGNDAIVVKSGVNTWNDVFEHAVGFTGYSVSEYMACFASHTANQPMKLPVRFDDASEAVDAWLNAGPEQDIQSIVVWQPEVARALSSLEGSRELLSSRDVRILWDVLEFSRARVQQDPAAFHAFTRAYYRALKDLTDDPAGALTAIVAWAGDDEGRQALLTTTDPSEFLADLDNEAFATLRDAGFLMDDLETLGHRLDEAAFYWTYCGVEVPEVAAVGALIAPEFVLAARDERGLLTGVGTHPGSQVFQVTDFTDASAVTDQQIQQASVLFESGIEIEFRPNRTDFLDEAAANAVLSNAVRFLRTCQDCVLQVQGGAAYPGQAVCPACRPEDSDTLAVDRGRRVYRELLQRFDVPDAQVRFLEAPHPPAYPGSNREEELRLDRRTFLVGLQLSGR
jgi:hypothetical protein